MRTVYAALVGCVMMPCAASHAARIQIDAFENSIYAVFLHGEELNDQFDTVLVDIVPDGSARFGNPVSTGMPLADPGDPRHSCLRFSG